MRATPLLLVLLFPILVALAQAAAPVQLELIPKGARGTWRYLDDGRQPPATWTAADFDDQGWKQGPAPLGYGEPDVATEIGFGGNPHAKYLAAYFRSSFNFAGDPAAVGRLAIEMRIDDGAVVYLNGHELVRQNIPSGAVTVRTHAIWRVDGAEEKLYRFHVVPATALQRGNNVLAVEVHQINVVSSDLFLDLRLTTTEEPAPHATLAAHDVTFAYWKNHYVPAGTSIPDGYVDGGHAMQIAGDGTVRSGREIIVVDRARDLKLRQHLEYVRWLKRAKLPALLCATLLAEYVDLQYSPADGRSFSLEASDALLAPYAGKEVLIGDIMRGGVCRHRALVFKLLADEAGLSVALVRGHLGEQARDYHTWNELLLAGGEKVVVDVMNPLPGYAFPKTTDRVAAAYRTLDDKPYYPRASGAGE